MRQVCYAVASSLDGFIAGPHGEADWIVMDPEIDFGAIFSRYDTLLIGRSTWEAMAGQGSGSLGDMKVFVFSRTLRSSDHPNVTVVGDGFEQIVRDLKAAPGKDIWLFGGGLLFKSLLGAGLVDAVSVAVIPVLLGGGIPLFPPPANRANLQLTTHKVFSKTGIVSLEYSVRPPKLARKRAQRVTTRAS